MESHNTKQRGNFLKYKPKKMYKNPFQPVKMIKLENWLCSDISYQIISKIDPFIR